MFNLWDITQLLTFLLERINLTEGTAVEIHEPLGYSSQVDQLGNVLSGTSFDPMSSFQKIKAVWLLSSLSLYNQHS